MSRKKKWLLWLAVATGFSVAALFIAGIYLARHFQPYIREQAIEYLSERFDSDVELADLKIHLPGMSPVRMLLSRGRSMRARVEGRGLVLRSKITPDGRPIFSAHNFGFSVDLGSLFGSSKVIPLVWLDGVEIVIPAKREKMQKLPEGAGLAQESGVHIQQSTFKNVKLVILPKAPDRLPLEFQIHDLRLTSTGTDSLDYSANLTNAKPPGEIESQGKFGPWSADEPGETPLAGKYQFDRADMGVFTGIAGTLRSSGSFEGTLSSIRARGEASIPDFRLKTSGNAVPLTTRFEVVVDGTNGNTTLNPVKATLGSTSFTTTGAVVKHQTDPARTITLGANIPDGDLRDLLRLAAKGPPFMEGRISLKTTIRLPPLSGTVKEKLVLDGQFQLSQAKFLRSTIQDQIDNLSRRGQGQPGNREIDEVVSHMSGKFHLEDEVMAFDSLSFGVPGADVDLKGRYSLADDGIDFHGDLKLRAKVSQTVTGIKRFGLKVVDPFFAKNGAGTFLRIQVVGTSKEPKFGRERGK